MALTDLANPPSPSAPTFSNPWNPVSDISDGRNYLDTLANNYILKPATNKGINGYVFSVVAESTATADTDITEHYTEYNNFLQDHAALRPLEITMRGFAAEQVLPAPQGVTGVLSTLQSKLTQLPALLGKYTPQALSKVQAVVTKAQNIADQVDNVIGRVKNMAGLIVGGSAANSVQSLAASKLFAMRDSRSVFTLDTPWGMLGSWDPVKKKGTPRSFIIKRLVLEQSEETKDITDIVVTLKEVRFATVTTQDEPGQTDLEAQQNCLGVAQSRMQSPAYCGIQTQSSPVDFSEINQSFQPAVGQ